MKAKKLKIQVKTSKFSIPLPALRFSTVRWISKLIFKYCPSKVVVGTHKSSENEIMGTILTAAALLFLGYEGFGLITNTAEDIENPRKNIPRALYLSVIMVMLIYVLVSISVVGNLSIPAITKTSDYALAAAAKPFAGSLGFTVMISSWL